MPSVDYQLGQITQQLDDLSTLPQKLDDFRAEVKRDIAGVHKRVDTIATRHSWFAGASTAAGAFLGAIAGYLGGHHG
jgi:hypothetical protein